MIMLLSMLCVGPEIECDDDNLKESNISIIIGRVNPQGFVARANGLKSYRHIC
jgi:hypothetical protein